MRVHNLEDGSIRFVGEVVQIDLDARSREAVVTSPARGTYRLAFRRVHQVGLVGRPGGFLALHLGLSDGQTIELGHVADPKLGYQVASRVASLIDCAFGGIVRMASSFVSEQFEGPTAWMDMITSMEPPARRSREDASTARTQEVAIDDIVCAWPKERLEEEATDATVMEVIVDGAKTVEVPSLSARTPLLDEFDSACAALLDLHSGGRH